MVTDLVGHTVHLHTIGDAAMYALMQMHDTLVLREIKKARGIVSDHTGDGFIVGFASVRNALNCAAQIQRVVAELDAMAWGVRVHVRIGLHAGEPLVLRKRLLGLCVNTTFRVCDASQASCVLATRTVFDLAAGLGFPFVSRGSRRLKSLPERFALYEFLWRESPAVAVRHTRSAYGERLTSSFVKPPIGAGA